jgi:hypothetical protein
MMEFEDSKEIDMVMEKVRNNEWRTPVMFIPGCTSISLVGAVEHYGISRLTTFLPCPEGKDLDGFVLCMRFYVENEKVWKEGERERLPAVGWMNDGLRLDPMCNLAQNELIEQAFERTKDEVFSLETCAS